MPGDSAQLPLGEATGSARRHRQAKCARHLPHQLSGARPGRGHAERLLFRRMRSGKGPGRAAAGFDLVESVDSPLSDELRKISESYPKDWASTLAPQTIHYNTKEKGNAKFDQVRPEGRSGG